MEKQFELSNKSIYAYFYENTVKFPDRTAYMSETESYTWKEAFRMFNYLVKRFKDWGMGKGKMVAIRSPRTIDAPFVILAAVSTESTITICDHARTAADFLSNCTAPLKPDFIIGQNYYGVWTVHTKEGKIHTFDKKDGENFSEELIAPMTCAKEDQNYIFFTSGSTGKSKAAILSQYSLDNNRYQLITNGDTHEGKTVMIMPIHHIFGVAIMQANMSVGACVMFPKTRDPEYVLDFIEKYKCNRIDTVPTYYFMLIDAQKRKARDISSLKHGVIAGGAYSKQQFLYIEENLGLTISPSYGMTETSTVVCFTAVQESLEVRSTGLGKFIPHVEGVLKSLDGKLIHETGVTGEICVRGASLMIGYIEPNGEVRLPLDKDGYFHTGDLAYRDEEGFLYMTCRCKDIIIRGGENISPLRIQEKIAEMEGVKNVCVIGVPSEKYGEEVGACVQAKGVTEEEIKDFLKDFFNKSEIPSKFLFVEEIPALAIGKPDKQTIQKMFAKKYK